MGGAVSGEFLAIDGVSKRFGGLIAVDAISFSVAAGEIVSIIGPNGAGKTTLFNLLAGQLAPSGGTNRLSTIRWKALYGSAKPRLTLIAPILRGFRSAAVAGMRETASSAIHCGPRARRNQ